MAELNHVAPLQYRLRTEIDIKVCCIVDCHEEATRCHYLNLKFDVGHVDLYTCEHKGHIKEALRGLHQLRDTCDAISEKVAYQPTQH